jgi:hypothetical protein
MQRGAMSAYDSHKHIIWRLLQKKCRVEQGRTHPERQVARATKFRTVVPNIYGSSVWNWLHVIHCSPRRLRWHLDFSLTSASLAWQNECVRNSIRHVI